MAPPRNAASASLTCDSGRVVTGIAGAVHRGRCHPADRVAEQPVHRRVGLELKGVAPMKRERRVPHQIVAQGARPRSEPLMEWVIQFLTSFVARQYQDKVSAQCRTAHATRASPSP